MGIISTIILRNVKGNIRLTCSMTIKNIKFISTFQKNKTKQKQKTKQKTKNKNGLKDHNKEMI